MAEKVQIQQTTTTTTVVSGKWIFVEVKNVQPATPAQGVSQ